MVFFTCNSCGESLKKNKVEKHIPKCGNFQSVSCIDCSQVFSRNSYGQHIKCISEDVKYGGANYVPKDNKGEVKQSQWIQQVQNVISGVKADAKLSALLEQLTEYPNIPRKQKKFVNFVKNSLNVRNDALISQLWTLLSQEIFSKTSADTKDKQEQQTDAPTEQNGSTNGHLNTSQNGGGLVGEEPVGDMADDKERKKKEKKEKKKKKKKQDGEESKLDDGINGVQEDAACTNGTDGHATVLPDDHSVTSTPAQPAEVCPDGVNGEGVGGGEKEKKKEKKKKKNKKEKKDAGDAEDGGSVNAATDTELAAATEVTQSVDGNVLPAGETVNGTEQQAVEGEQRGVKKREKKKKKKNKKGENEERDVDAIATTNGVAPVVELEQQQEGDVTRGDTEMMQVEGEGQEEEDGGKRKKGGKKKEKKKKRRGGDGEEKDGGDGGVGEEGEPSAKHQKVDELAHPTAPPPAVADSAVTDTNTVATSRGGKFNWKEAISQHLAKKASSAGAGEEQQGELQLVQVKKLRKKVLAQYRTAAGATAKDPESSPAAAEAEEKLGSKFDKVLAKMADANKVVVANKRVKLLVTPA